MNKPVRCFLAVKTPLDRAQALREAQAQLRAAGGNWKWVDPDTFHLTLKFLGDVEESRTAEIWESVSAALVGSEAFAIRFRGLSVFPNLRLPRVAWAGIDHGAAELHELARKVEEACSAHGFERERRPFRAHLTLGRARRPESNSALAGVIEGMADAELGETDVSRVLLMKSTLTPKGAIYDVLEEHLLDHGEAE